MNNNILYLLFFEHFLDNNSQYNLYDIYMSDDIISMISYILSVNLAIDRAELLNQYSQFNIASPMHIEGIVFDRDMKYKKHNLVDVCNEVALYYIKKANDENKKLAVMWSGGVDSTVMLCAFLQCSKLNLNNFIVLLTSDSVAENDYFFNNFIKGKCKYIKYNSSEYKQRINSICQDFIFVSGHNGDQLFGHKFVLRHPKFYGLDYASTLSDIYRLYLNNKSDEYINRLVEKHLSIYKSYFNELCDVDIKTVETFVWALKFMCKWCWVRLDHVMRCANTDLLQSYYTFFSHRLFQSWALYNKKYHNETKVNPYIQTKLYKKEFKEYIYSYDKNEEYLKNKGKQSSPVEYAKDDNINNFSVYSNQGIQTYNINIHGNSKFRIAYEIHKHLARFYK